MISRKFHLSDMLDDTYSFRNWHEPLIFLFFLLGPLYSAWKMYLLMRWSKSFNVGSPLVHLSKFSGMLLTLSRVALWLYPPMSMPSVWVLTWNSVGGNAMISRSKPLHVYNLWIKQWIVLLLSFMDIQPSVWTLVCSRFVWHRLLAWSLLHKTRPEIWPLVIPYTG